MATTALAVALAAMASTGVQADWLQFRGAQGAGVSPEGGLPRALDGEKSVAWKVALPGEGLSSPLIIGERIILTCSSGAEQDRLHVFCRSVHDGSVIWERQFWATGRTMHHEKTSVAAPSPCSDGERIFALYSSNDLVALDLDGNLLWLRGLTVDYPNASNSLGLATSLVMADGVVVAQIENDSESFAAGIDADTGENLWKIDRTKRANWCTPITFRDPRDGSVRVALQGSAGVDAVDPRTGSIVWSFTDGAATTESSTVAGDTLYVPSNGLTALKLAGGGSFNVAWTKGNLRPGTASPVAVGDRVYVVTGAGVLNAADASTGERLWQTRLEGPCSGSPIVEGDRLFVVSEREGTAQLVDLTGAEGTVIGTVELGEMVQCTPAVANGAAYVRSDGHLWKLVAP